MQEKDSSIIIKGKNSLTIFIEEKTSISETKLFENELKTLYLIQNKQRKLEFIQVRSIRNKYFENLEIKYTSYGKPYFENSGSLFLSISHSLNYVGIITAPFDVGLDIEELHPRILRVENRFLNEKEKMLMSDSIETLTIAWTLKEALFKINNRSGIDFKTELLIEDKTQEGYNCKMLDIDGWKLVKLKVLQKGNLIISYNFEPPTLL